MTLSRRHLQFVALTSVIAIAMTMILALDAHARGSRGPSPQQVKAAQEQMKQQQAMQAEYAKAQQKADADTIKRFDSNMNGKIDGTEKAAWDKYWRDVKSGKVAHPYASIKITPASTTSGKPAAKKPATK